MHDGHRLKIGLSMRTFPSHRNHAPSSQYKEEDDYAFQVCLKGFQESVRDAVLMLAPHLSEFHDGYSLLYILHARELQIEIGVKPSMQVTSGLLKSAQQSAWCLLLKPNCSQARSSAVIKTRSWDPRRTHFSFTSCLQCHFAHTCLDSSGAT